MIVSTFVNAVIGSLTATSTLGQGSLRLTGVSASCGVVRRSVSGLASRGSRRGGWGTRRTGLRRGDAGRASSSRRRSCCWCLCEGRTYNEQHERDGCDENALTHRVLHVEERQ